jgi:hypothetical protein
VDIPKNDVDIRHSILAHDLHFSDTCISRFFLILLRYDVYSQCLVQICIIVLIPQIKAGFTKDFLAAVGVIV